MGAFGEVKVCHQRPCLEHGVEGAGGGGTGRGLVRPELQERLGQRVSEAALRRLDFIPRAVRHPDMF